MSPAPHEDNPGDGVNASSYPHILGCLNQNSICGPTGSCFDASQVSPTHHFKPNATMSNSEAGLLNLLSLSMTIGGFGLEGPRISRPLVDVVHPEDPRTALAGNYWHAEVRRLFDISLARIQATIVDLAWSKNHDRAGYRSAYAEADMLSGACSSVKVHTIGWRNVNLIELVCLSVFLIFLWISTIKLGEHVLLVRLYQVLIGSFTRRLYRAAKVGFLASLATVNQEFRALPLQWRRITSHRSRSDEIA